MPKPDVTFHMDREVERKLVALNDEICTWERSTGRGYTLVLIPHQRDEGVHVSVDGKPVADDEMRGRPPMSQGSVAETARGLGVLDRVKHALSLRGGR